MKAVQALLSCLILVLFAGCFSDSNGDPLERAIRKTCERATACGFLDVTTDRCIMRLNDRQVHTNLIDDCGDAVLAYWECFSELSCESFSGDSVCAVQSMNAEIACEYGDATPEGMDAQAACAHVRACNQTEGTMGSCMYREIATMADYDCVGEFRAIWTCVAQQECSALSGQSQDFLTSSECAAEESAVLDCIEAEEARFAAEFAAAMSEP